MVEIVSDADDFDAIWGVEKGVPPLGAFVAIADLQTADFTCEEEIATELDVHSWCGAWLGDVAVWSSFWDHLKDLGEGLDVSDKLVEGRRIDDRLIQLREVVHGKISLLE